MQRLLQRDSNTRCRTYSPDSPRRACCQTLGSWGNAPWPWTGCWAQCRWWWPSRQKGPLPQNAPTFWGAPTARNSPTWETCRQTCTRQEDTASGPPPTLDRERVGNIKYSAVKTINESNMAWIWQWQLLYSPISLCCFTSFGFSCCC